MMLMVEAKDAFENLKRACLKAAVLVLLTLTGHLF